MRKRNCSSHISVSEEEIGLSEIKVGLSEIKVGLLDKNTVTTKNLISRKRRQKVTEYVSEESDLLKRENSHSESNMGRHESSSSPSNPSIPFRMERPSRLFLENSFLPL